MAGPRQDSPEDVTNEEFIALGECLAELGRQCKITIGKGAFDFWADRYHKSFYNAIHKKLPPVRWKPPQSDNALRHVAKLAARADELAKEKKSLTITRSIALQASGDTDCKPGIGHWERFCEPPPTPARKAGARRRR